MADQQRRAIPNTTDAVDAAMDRVGDDPIARTLLEKHSRLIDAQIRNERLEHRNKQAMIAFRSVLTLAALAVILGFAWMLKNARSDRGLVIEALSVPPDLAARGLTGEAMASNLADKLADIDRTARSFRSPQTMTVNWGNDVKIQIPETGVSIGELDAFLRRALGHQTTIGGALFRTPQRLRLTVRAGGTGAVEQTGTDANLEAMIQTAAEGVFAKTQAYRFSKYLEFKGRTDEAMTVARDIIRTDDDPKERAWAWAQVSNLLIMTDTRAAVAAAYRGIEEDPANALSYLNGCIAAGHLSHEGEQKRLCDTASRLGSDPAGGLSDIGINTSRSNQAFSPAEAGDFGLALKRFDALRGPVYPGLREARDVNRASLSLALHDVPASRRLAGNLTDRATAATYSASAGIILPQYDDAMEVGDYDRAALSARDVIIFLKSNPETPHLSALLTERTMRPKLAGALALGGNIEEARAIAATLPLDCGNCLMTRSIVAGAAGDFAEARRWNSQAVRIGINPLFARDQLAKIALRNRRWAEALAEADGAVALGPNYADAHKARGDALRRLGRFDEAVEAYRRAGALAPQWGRLRIDWGMAELGAGHSDKARSRFYEASRLFLSARDRLVLAAVRPFAAR